MLIVEVVIDREWIQSEGATRRFGEKRREVNEIQGRLQ